MFLRLAQASFARSGFPRVRGDVPENLMKLSELTRFSPRARGCSHCGPKPLECTGVFPACAGMFLEKPTCSPSKGCFPRVRGDVPPYMIGIEPQSEFSPRARGCSEHPQHVSPDPPVFPACAGMFLINGSSVVWLMSFPRVRGDVPWSQAKSCISRWFSPRARGCSYDLGLTIEHIPVFPACAGMFRAGA